MKLSVLTRVTKPSCNIGLKFVLAKLNLNRVFSVRSMLIWVGDILNSLTFAQYMSRRITKYVLVIWFSALLMLGNTPMDFIHSFADHKDTVHKEHHGLVIEKKHHHCAFLSLTIAAFINDYHLPVVTFTTEEFFIRHQALIAHFLQDRIVEVSLRGPPAA
jgi:hypothetical protein